MKKSACQGRKEIIINEQVRDWTSSGAGMKALDEALKQAAHTSDQLQAARMVDPQKLRTPLNL